MFIVYMNCFFLDFEGAIKSVVVSLDSKYFVSGFYDKIVRVWRIRDVVLMYEFLGIVICS